MQKYSYLLALSVMAMLPSAASNAQSVEEIFDEARNYTTYITTRIEVPFIEDEQGSFSGAGFIINNERRWILTNAHVTGKSPAEITVTFSDDTRVDATPVYIDSYLDLAVLTFVEPDGFKLTEAELECESTPGIGHPVGTFGHPEGLRFTGTRGIVSGRTFQFNSDWLQTDAPISHGNSGGPLISLKTGRVVGINSASVEANGAQNMNLAVLSTQACRIIDLMLDGKDPRPADLSVGFFEYDGEPTLLVGQLFSLNQKIGLQRDDHIFAVGDTALHRMTKGELLHHLRGRLDDAELRLIRAGNEIEISTSLAPHPNVTDRTGIYVAGALFSITNHPDMASLNLNPVVMVHSVESGSAAEAAGISPYDHLLSINGQRIASLNELRELIEVHEPNTIARLGLLRFVNEENRFLQDVMAEIYLDDMLLIEFAEKTR